MINPKTTETMKTQSRKLTDLIKRIKQSSRINSRLAKSAPEDHLKGLYKGYADAYELTAGWIQEIIHYELQDKENIDA